MNAKLFAPLVLLAALCGLVHAQAPEVLVIGGAPSHDVKQSFGLVLDNQSQAAANLTKLQAQANLGQQSHTWFWQSTTNNSAPHLRSYHINNTLILPATWGRSEWQGIGLGGGQLMLRAQAFATVFDGTTNYFTEFGTTTANVPGYGNRTVSVIQLQGRAVTTQDRYNSFEITGGTGWIAGWYEIVAADTVNNRLTLSRDATSATPGNGQGYYCPAIVRDHGVDWVRRGMKFGAVRQNSDTRKASILYHIPPQQISSDQTTGRARFENCVFEGPAEVGIMCGYGLDSAFGIGGIWPPENPERVGNHADNITSENTRFHDCVAPFYVGNRQSVHHEHDFIRAINMKGFIFTFQSGGFLKSSSVEISGNFSNKAQGLLWLGDGVGENHSPFVIDTVRWDGGTQGARNPVLIQTQFTVAKQVRVEISNVTLNRRVGNENMKVIDVQSGVNLTLRNCAPGDSQEAGIRAGQVRVRAVGGKSPVVYFDNVRFGFNVAACDDVISDDSEDTSAVFFNRCETFGGTRLDPTAWPESLAVQLRRFLHQRDIQHAAIERSRNPLAAAMASDAPMILAVAP